MNSFIKFLLSFLLLLHIGTSGSHGEQISLVHPGAELKLLQSTFKFTEGPATDKDGNVFFTDQPNDRIVRWNAKTGELKDWLKPAGRSNGMYFDKDGNLITCADEKNQLWSISPGKKIKVVVESFENKFLNGPNDLWIHPNGDIYFTDPLYKRPYWKRDGEMQQPGRYVYLLKKGTQKPIVAAKDFVQPNGIVGTPDGKHLFVADIDARKTYKFNINPDGNLTNRKLFCESGSDGMTLDENGNLYLTGRGVTVFNPQGEKIQNIPVPRGWTANVVFGGSNHDQLFITALDSVFTLKMNVKGARPVIQNASSLVVEEKEFGRLDNGKSIHQYTLKNTNGLEVKIINLGAIITSIKTPDRHGKFANVIQGSQNLGDYLKSFPSAAVIGRFANRIKNASFSIDGKQYHVTTNNGKNHIHGGRRGFAKQVWSKQKINYGTDSCSVILEYHSKDGEEGFPGNLKTSVEYVIDNSDTLHIHYKATTDKATILNLTNHAYFNLGVSKSIKPIDHELWLNAAAYTEVDKQLIPTGVIRPVKGTPLDFQSSKLIGKDIQQVTGFRKPIYDHNFIISREKPGMTLFARVKETTTGRIMEVHTDQPGVQLYTGNPKGLCLETQHYPDSINHPHFPSPILRPGGVFKSSTSFHFTTANKDN